jgi:energy-coupling factor transporter ATP-binding protein EcfA2
LAELHVADHNNAIIFDDPVSSLDHVFTRKTATRLAKEGLTWQLIIFTHDIAFLMELEDACEELAKAGTPVPLTIHTLRRGGRSAGITMDGAPWHAMKVKQRAQHLEERLHIIKHLYEENMPEYNKEASHLYGLLREA